MKHGEVEQEERVVEVGFLGAFSVWESKMIPRGTTVG